MDYKYYLDSNGKLIFYTHAITNDEKTIYCESEERANAMLKNSRYSGYYVINLDTPDETLSKLLKGVRFDDADSAKAFLEGGYVDSVSARLSDLEQIVLSTVLGGDE